jgi:heme/copper-type cytochrome/quinol oxidase subunit 2
MDAKALESISKLAAAVGQTAGQVAEHYTTWFIISASIWICAGVVLLLVAWKLRADSLGEFHGVPIGLAKLALIGIGVLLVLCNLPDLLAPEGIALHQLIKDLRG